MNFGSYVHRDPIGEAPRHAPHERAMPRKRSIHTYRGAPEDAAIYPSPCEPRSADQREHYVRWCVKELGNRQALSVTLTFRPPDKRIPVTFETAKSALSTFKKMLIRRLFRRNQTRLRSRQDLLYFVAVIEGGVGGNEKHIHAHACIGVPDGVCPDELTAICQELWGKLRCASRENNVIRVCSDTYGWISYILKDRDKPSYSQAIIVELLSFASNKSRHSESRASTWRAA